MKPLFLSLIMMLGIMNTYASIVQTISPYQVKSSTRRAATGQQSQYTWESTPQAGYYTTSTAPYYNYTSHTLAYFDLGNLTIGDLTNVKVKFTMKKINAPLINDGGFHAKTRVGAPSCSISAPVDLFNCSGTTIPHIGYATTNSTSGSTKTLTVSNTNILGNSTSNSFVISIFNDPTGSRMAQISNIEIEITHCGPLDNLNNLQATSGNNSIQLSWSPVPHATSYQVYTCNGTSITTTNNTSYTISGLPNAYSNDYKVKPISSCNSSSFSNCVAGYTILPTPSNNSFSVSANSNTSVNINWSGVNGADSYELRTCNGTVINNNIQGTSYTVNNLASGTNHSFKVRAIKSTNNVKSNFTTCKSVTLAPNTPSNLSASAISENRIDLNWSNTTGASSYKIYSCSGNYIGSTGSTNYSHTGLNQLTQYAYKVVASNSTGDSPASACKTAKTKIAPPSGINLIGLDPEEFEISWNPVQSASYYEIYGCNGGLLQGNITSTDAFFENLTPGSYQSLKIRTIGGGSTSNFSQCFSFHMLCDPPSVTASTLSQSEIKLDWNAVSGATGYKIYDCNGNYITSSSGTSKTITGLNASTQYKFRVTTLNGDNIESEPSNCASSVTRIATPSNFYLESLNSHTIRLHFAPSQVAQAVEIYDCNNNFIGYDDANTNFMDVSNLTPGQSYSFKIRFGGSANIGSFSDYTVCKTETPMPKAPSNYQITPISDTELKLTWIAPVNESNVTYEIFNCRNNQKIASVHPTSYSVINLKGGKNYVYKVRTKVSNGVTSSFTQCVNEQTMPGIPTLYGEAYSDSKISLYWATTANSATFNIYDCNGNFIQSTGYRDDVISGLSPATQYDFKITESNPNGTSGFSNCLSITTKYPTPQNLSWATNGWHQDITLSWSPVNNITHYEVYTCDGTHLGTTNDLYFHIDELPVGYHYFKIRAKDPSNSGLDSRYTTCIEVDIEQGHGGTGKKGNDESSVEVNEKKSLIAYPNPNEGDILFFNNNITGEVFDTKGQSVTRIVNSNELNISNFTKGIYIIKTKEGEIVKLIKK